MEPRFLTKSRFKLAMECPTKLYYTGKTEYANQKLDNPFLSALADGGFQVGELAKCYYPGGHEIKTLDRLAALEQTNELLKQDRIIIYEAAIQHNHMYIRVDVLVKDGNRLEMIEVKAKSYDANKDCDFLGKQGRIISTWKPYLYDIAFQKYVASCAFPQYTISASLMMADKNAVCQTEGLNQKFKIVKQHNRSGVIISPSLRAEDLDHRILVAVNVDMRCSEIYTDEIEFGAKKMSFYEYIQFLEQHYDKDLRIDSALSSGCKDCEFKATAQEKQNGLKSGFEECWKRALGWTDMDFEKQNVLDIWYFSGKDKFLSEGRIKLDDIFITDIDPANDGKPGISKSERQWMQVEKEKTNDPTYWFDSENMRNEFSTWRYPLHFIDFETASVAIPFNKGRHPYEGVAFQFSHHIVYEDGRVEHKGQYLNTEQGKFPNYDFVRHLKSELENDNGTIFRYCYHENTYLNMIYRQLQEDPEAGSDVEELCSFIRSITQSKEHGEGSRNMVDLWELVKRYYYDPATKGKNSIKFVLPAILNSSTFLQKKYAAPIYGASDGIPSLNYENWTWIQQDQDGSVKDPYKLLPKLFQDLSEKELELLSEDDELRDGGAALTAYARMQFEEMTEYERSQIEAALLKYCELDTLAMVMIYEGWKAWLEDGALE